MTNPERTNESIAQYITKVGIFPNGSVEHLSWQKEEIIKALGAKDALYNKACGGRAYLDEQVMKLQHEKSELQRDRDSLQKAFNYRIDEIASLTKENSELREKLKGLRECLEELKSYFLGQRKMPYFMSEYEQRLIKGKVSSIDYALKQFEDVSIEDPAITGHAGPCNDSCSKHDVKPKEDGE